jgi:predicted P-loop ATPase
VVSSKGPTEKTAFELECESIKKKYGIDVEPVKGGKYKIERTIKFIESKFDFRFNIINKEIEFRAKDTKAFQYFDTREFNTLLNEIKLENIVIGREALKTLIESKQVSLEYDPIKEYLLDLPIWDRRDYIKEFLQQICLKDEGERQTFIKTFKKWFTAMIAGLIEDQVTNQCCFVLVGKQGIYKTTFLNNLVPKHLQMDYLFSSKFNFENKDHFKYLGTKMLINLDELASFSRTEEGILKTILTEGRVVVRLPYGEFDSKMWRKASFCGSTNNKDFLKDETGNRRFLVFEIDSIYPKEFNLDLIYSQAIGLFKEKFQYWFDSSEVNEVEKRNIEFHDISIEEDLIQQYLQCPDKEELSLNIGYKWKTTTFINTYLASRSNRINVNETTKRRVGMVLKKLGYARSSKRMNQGEVPVKVWAVKLLDGDSFEENQIIERNEGII